MDEDVSPLRWVGQVDGHLVLLDQTQLPARVVEIACRDVAAVVDAIRQLRVRGAPAIGIAAAYGVCLGTQAAAGGDQRVLLARLEESVARLAASRPTAVNLFWALQRMQAAARTAGDRMPPEAIRKRLLAEAHAIRAEDERTCRAIGRLGAELLIDGHGVLTHCNAGGLATSGYGTALAVLFSAHAAGKRLHVYVDETRPLFQGARLTAWELRRRQIDTTVICDSMAAQVMREGRVQAVITGADRIAANGDTANKIGTYAVALAAAAHKVPFYVAAPTSTFDLTRASGSEIPIEQRAADEVIRPFDVPIAPDGVDVYNPAFDVTPAALITAIICEQAVIRPVTGAAIAAAIPPTGPTAQIS